MGIKLIILLALLIGVLYSIHILVQDYQAITAPKLLRLLFKRDTNTQQNHHGNIFNFQDKEYFNDTLVKQNKSPHVRWRKILQYDPIQCARLLYCDLGAEPPIGDIRRGFIFMLTLEPHLEDKSSLEIFRKAYQIGRIYGKGEYCRKKFPTCIIKVKVLMELIQYLIKIH